MDAQKLTSLGGSLPVPCVQELAKKTLTTVPPRYLRPEQDPPFLSDSSTTCSSIHAPVIDFNRLVSGDSMDSELDKLHYACKEWGFFQVWNQFTCIKSRPNCTLKSKDVESYALVAAEGKAEIVNHMQLKSTRLLECWSYFYVFVFAVAIFMFFAFKLNSDAIL